MLAKGGKKLDDLVENLWKKIAEWFLKSFDDAAKIAKLEVQNFISKVPKGIAKFVNLLPKEIQRRVVNGLLVLEFQGKTIAKLNPKGIFVEITYFREAKDFSQIAELKNVKLELTIIDDSGKPVIKNMLIILRSSRKVKMEN